MPSAPRFLMCPPSHFAVEYEINPLMHAGTQVDVARAVRQWEALRAALQDAGATVVEQEAVPGLPDLVFTRNSGLAWGERVLLSRFRHPERRPETPHDRATFERLGLQVVELDEDAGSFEGSAEAMPFAGVLVCGHGYRTDRAAHAPLASFTGLETVAVELTVNAAYYHLDVAFCPLDDASTALVNPFAMPAASLARLRELVPDPVLLTREEADAFCANSVAVGGRVLLPHVTDHLRDELARRGLEAVHVDVSELMKGGGAAGCMVLPLHVGA